MGNVAQLVWLASGICFILSLGGLSQHETARRGNWFGIVGITLAILATFFSGEIAGGQWLLILALIVGGVCGAGNSRVFVVHTKSGPSASLRV